MFRAQLDTSASIRSTSSITGFTRNHKGNSVKRLLLLLVVYFIYIVSGAFVFQLLEGGNEENLRKRLWVYIGGFLNNNSCVDTNELTDLVTEVVYAMENGLKHVGENETSDEFGFHQWDLPNSLFFATTVITTIGYGNMAPRTDEGRIFCVIFAFFGIPLTGWFLTVFGQCSERHWKSFTDKFDKTVAFLKFPTAQKFAVYLTIVVLLYLIVILIPSTIIHFVEDWSWGVAHYYTFISLSTIGFGDYVAGNGTKLNAVIRIVYKIGLILYLILGLAVLTLTFKVTQHYQRKNASRMQTMTRGVARRVMSKRRNAIFEKQKQEKGNRVTVNLRTAKYDRQDSESGETFTISIDEFGRCLKDVSTQTAAIISGGGTKLQRKIIHKKANSIILTSSQRGIMRRGLSWGDEEDIFINLSKSDTIQENCEIKGRDNAAFVTHGT